MNCRKNASSLSKCVWLLLLTHGLLALGATAFSNRFNPPLVSIESGATGAVSDSPGLSIAYVGSTVIIEWPSSARGWVLEQSSDPNSHSWECVPLISAQTNATTIVITTATAGANMFYRLRMPAPANISALTGAWTFDDTDCHLAQDASGSGNLLALSNVVSSTGRIGPGALRFNGGAANAGGSRAWASNDNYRLLPSQGAPFSVSLWFNPDALINGWRGLLGTDANGNGGWHLALHTLGPGTNELVFASSGFNALNVTTLSSAPGRKLLLPGQWHELTATYDGNEGVMYLDGESVVRGSGVLLANDQPLYLGGGVGGYDSFLGRIDEVRIFTNALPAESISLTGEWRMDENGGALLADSSIQDHTASLSDPGAWTAGKQGAGINLSNGVIIIRNDSSEVLPPTGGAFSLSFWIRPTGLSSDWNGLMSCAGTNGGWQMAVSGGEGVDQLRFWSTDLGGTLDLSTPVVLAEGIWSKLDLTFNGGIAIVYLNGVKVAEAVGGIQGSTQPLMIGAVNGMPNFNGAIDELKIYRRERREDEVGPVAKVMWETVLIDTTTNLVLQGIGPSGKPLIYSIVDVLSPTNGVLSHDSGSPIVTYAAGQTKGPDAFTYTVSDGEFTSPPKTVILSLVQPHWLSPTGGSTAPLDGADPDHAWIAGSADALDAIWGTNQYYDCFFYAPGEYQTRGWKFNERGTANPGCKHIGSGSEGVNRTTIKLVDTWEAQSEGLIFGDSQRGSVSDNFEAHHLFLDCNAANNPQYAIGEPVWIVIPLLTTTRVEKVTLRWNYSLSSPVPTLPDGRSWWQFGAASQFDVCARLPGTNGYTTNCISVTSTGSVDVVSIGAQTDQIVLQLRRRASGVDFYSLGEVQLSGVDGTNISPSLPVATIPGGGTSGQSPILNAFDDRQDTVWTSGPENQVDIVIPLAAGTALTEIDLSWNCKTLSQRLGPALSYNIQIHDENGQWVDVPFTRQARTLMGREANTFANPIVTDAVLIRLTSKESTVDFYSLREIQLQNGSALVRPKLPTALTSFAGGNYHILRAFDGDISTQWTCDTQGMIGAIHANGNNMKFTDLHVVHFGNKAGRECFVITLQPPPPGGPGPYSFGNVLVQDCIVNSPATNNTHGITAVNVNGALRPLTNVTIRSCTVADLKPWFADAQAFSVVNLENCVVTNCGKGIYYEPAQSWGDSLGPVLIRSNSFLNVSEGIAFTFRPPAVFDSLTCVANEFVLRGANGFALAACDVCNPGLGSTITNLIALNNIVRYPDWSPRPSGFDGGFLASDIHNAVFGNNIVALGTANPLRVRQCPGPLIYAPVQEEMCDFLPPPPPPPPPIRPA